MSFRQFEIKEKPLFASMRRAKAALAKRQRLPCDVKAFFDYLENQYGSTAHNIEYVTFYDYYVQRVISDNTRRYYNEKHINQRLYIV